MVTIHGKTPHSTSLLSCGKCTSYIAVPTNRKVCEQVVTVASA
jgi:hypothetical protein